MQRDGLHVARDAGKAYGEPKFVQRIQEYLEKVAAANVSLMEKLARDYTKPEFGLYFTTIDGRKVEVTEQVVEASNRMASSVVDVTGGAVENLARSAD